MLSQLALGSGLILLTTVVSALFWLVLESILLRLKNWTHKPPHGLKLMAVLCIALGSTLLMMTTAVWIWAITLWILDVFITFEASMYFSLVAFTTLGFGDILLPTEWRLLGGLSAANGLLLFGLMTAMLVETLRELRLSQRKLGR